MSMEETCIQQNILMSVVNPDASSKEGTVLSSGLSLGRRFRWSLLTGLFRLQCYTTSIFAGGAQRQGGLGRGPCGAYIGRLGCIHVVQ
jgi:hypothetical protein